MHPAIVIMVAIVLGSGIMVGTVIGAHKVAAPPEAPVFLEQSEAPGVDPFVPLAQPAPAAPPAPGSAGSGDLGRCDPETLVAYLAAHRPQAQAWVDALDSDPALRWSGGSTVSVEQIPAYVAELHPMTLNADMRVTNHQFTGGRAVAVQSVLQRGTAVLVDAAGVARVRCACGNPLTPKRKIAAPPRYVGTPWSGFTPVRVEVTVVDRTDVDVETRDRCGRDEYFDGDRCRPAVECPPDLYLGTDGRCYFPVDPCPTGWERDARDRCYDPTPVYCDDGYVQRPDEGCADPPICPDGSRRDDGEVCDPVPRCPDDSVWDETSGTCTAPVRTPDCADAASRLPDGTCPAPADCPPGRADLRCNSTPPCPEAAPDEAAEPCPRPPDQNTSCPDDTVRDEASGTCTSSARAPGCPDGADPASDGTCPAPAEACPDGTTAPAGGTCPEPTQTCPDGTTVPASDPCPEPVRACPDGTTVPSDQTCPEPEQACPDGSTVPMSETCPEPVETCPDGSTVPSGESCPVPSTTTEGQSEHRARTSDRAVPV